MKNILQQFYFWSRKIHRLAMWFAIALSVFMGGTGLVLESAVEGEREWLTNQFDLQLTRQLHGATGKWLVIALFIMIFTGLVMWAYPLWVKRANKQPTKLS